LWLLPFDEFGMQSAAVVQFSEDANDVVSRHFELIQSVDRSG
jgi:hypothetical protein